MADTRSDSEAVVLVRTGDWMDHAAIRRIHRYERHQALRYPAFRLGQ